MPRLRQSRTLLPGRPGGGTLARVAPRLYAQAMEIWSLVEGRWQPGEVAGATVHWFDICGPQGGDLERLGERFGLHPLAIEDCVSTMVHAPKIDEFGDHLFIVMHAVVPGAETEEMDMFLGRDFVITYRDRELPAPPIVAETLRQGVTVRPGADGIVYEVMDRTVDAILPEVNVLSDRLDEIQQAVLSGGGDQNKAILEVRSQASQVRRLLSPQMTVLQRLSRGEFREISSANRIYFRDIYDHMVRIDLALEGVREDAEVVMSTYLTALNNRLSEAMKVLSVVGTLALPAVVIAGIFGTNFDNVPGIHSNWGFLTMVVAMAGLAGGMVLYFKRKGWF